MSIYGEYLTAVTPGLIAMSDLHLATSEHKDIPECHDYTPNRDSVAGLLKGRGFATKANLRGNLPLGHGFAASTVLAFLHLHDQVSVEQMVEIATECDELIHGFRPSGLDSMACLRQRSGFYCNGQWTNAAVPRFEYKVALLPKTVSRPLSEIKATISSSTLVLGVLADRLTSRILS